MANINIGDRFNSWEYIGVSSCGKSRYGHFRCECGCEKDVSVFSVVSGKSKSCGNCNANKLGITQKQYTKISSALRRAITRCYNPNYVEYSRYGGRGISVCNEWLNSTFAFVSWSLQNGWKDGLSLDRVDNDEGYSPNNCRWATAKQQASNRSNCIFIEHNGEKLSMMEWCERFCVPHHLPLNRWNRGERNFEELFSLVDKRKRGEVMLHYRP